MKTPRSLRWILRTLNGETWSSHEGAPDGVPSQDMPGVADRGSILPPPHIGIGS